MRVLVIDDQDEVRELLSRALARDGHVVELACGVAAGRAALGDRETDLVVLDVSLPDGDGVELCRALRTEGLTVPILMLTAQATIGSRVAGLEAGADDYLVKPFAVAELRARVLALGRRGQLVGGARHVIGAITLDLGARRALRGGVEIPVTAREWSVLDLLVRRRGQLVPRQELLEIVWGEADEARSASLDTILARMRRKLGDEIVRTVRGEGFRIGDATP